MPNNELFSEFPPVSKADWLRKITKDLKDKSLDDLEWNISDSLRMSPFIHSEDFKTAPQPLWTGAKGWEICETIQVEDAVTANAQAMEALTGGAEGLEFEFGSVPDWATFEQALAGVHLDFIGLHFSGQGAGKCLENVIGKGWRWI